jgi:hypothetical protein
MTFRLSVRSFHRGTLIELAARLGPHKPPLILKVESLVWDALFKLAEGRSSAYDVLSDLAESLPWSDINGVLNRGTEGWFILDPCMLFCFVLKMSQFLNIRCAAVPIENITAPGIDSNPIDVSLGSGGPSCMFICLLEFLIKD